MITNKCKKGRIISPRLHSFHLDFSDGNRYGKNRITQIDRDFFLRDNGKEKNPADPVDPVICVLFFGESWDRYKSSLPNKFVKRKNIEKKMIFCLTGFYPYT